MIEIKKISNFILDDISVSINEGEIFVILGPNGAGKTTFLNSIAGLCDYTGEISISNRIMEETPPENRGIGYLFQNLFLFPHMTVYENIAFGLKARKMEYKKRVNELLEFLNLKKISYKYPSNLSGGEKQKVALLRALSTESKIILMDEPFNNLDLETTKYLRIEFKKIIKKLSITGVFVTHNIKEAIELADRIAIFINGRIHQIGKPDEVFYSPKNDEVLSFIGKPNILKCDKYRYIGNGLTEVECGDLKILIPTDDEREVKKVTILPENIYISNENLPGPKINHYKGQIKKIELKNSFYNLEVEVMNIIIYCHLSESTIDSNLLKNGDQVHLIFPLKWMKWI